MFRTLANDEWSYLFGETDQRKGRYACGVTINGGDGDHTGCLVVAPDLCLNSYVFDTEKKYYSASEWTEAENAGLVCLPLTGVRIKEGNIIDRTMGKGLYWASNCSGENGAYGVEIDNAGIEIQDMSRWQGMCIRLVADVKE